MMKLVVASRNSAKEPSKPRGIEFIFLLDPTQYVFLLSFSPESRVLTFQCVRLSREKRLLALVPFPLNFVLKTYENLSRESKFV